MFSLQPPPSPVLLEVDGREVVTYIITAITVLAVAVPEGLPLAVPEAGFFIAWGNQHVKMLK